MSAPPRVVMVCPHCGSANVQRDGGIAYNPDTQAWDEVATVYDNTTCQDCGEDGITPEEKEEDA